MKIKSNAVLLSYLYNFEYKKYCQQSSYIKLKLLLIDSLACIGKDTSTNSISFSEIQFYNGRKYSCSPYTGPVLGTTYDAFTLSGNH